MISLSLFWSLWEDKGWWEGKDDERGKDDEKEEVDADTSSSEHENLFLFTNFC